MRIVPLEIGRLESSARALTQREGRITLPIASWLIEHNGQTALFDTGQHAELQHSKDRLGPLAPHFNPDLPADETLTARLEAAEVDPASIDIMVFSHLHFDHSGGTAEIPNARVVVQRAEWESGHESKLVEAGVYFPDQFDLGHDLELIDGEHDVFGDGRVRCLPTPGHTAGHQSLRVELDSGPTILTGDCIYLEWMLEEMALPAFSHDADQQLDSMRALKAHRDEHGCRLIFGHDTAQFAALPAELI